jgi:hypothetical protein
MACSIAPAPFLDKDDEAVRLLTAFHFGNSPAKFAVPPTHAGAFFSPNETARTSQLLQSCETLRDMTRRIRENDFSLSFRACPVVSREATTRMLAQHHELNEKHVQ